MKQITCEKCGGRLKHKYFVLQKLKLVFDKYSCSSCSFKFVKYNEYDTMQARQAYDHLVYARNKKAKAFKN